MTLLKLPFWNSIEALFKSHFVELEFDTFFYFSMLVFIIIPIIVLIIITYCILTTRDIKTA